MIQRMCDAALDQGCPAIRAQERGTKTRGNPWTTPRWQLLAKTKLHFFWCPSLTLSSVLNWEFSSAASREKKKTEESVKDGHQEFHLCSTSRLQRKKNGRQPCPLHVVQFDRLPSPMLHSHCVSRRFDLVALYGEHPKMPQEHWHHWHSSDFVRPKVWICSKLSVEIKKTRRHHANHETHQPSKKADDVNLIWSEEAIISCI